MKSELLKIKKKSRLALHATTCLLDGGDDDAVDDGGDDDVSDDEGSAELPDYADADSHPK